ncbi:MAG: hypothetical protein Q9163_005575 [Psora crenata]
MRSFRCAALGLLGAAAVASASDVHDLKKDTFVDFIKGHDLVLAEFFAPWCGHCKALAPEYEEAATILKEKDIPLVKVDCTEEVDLCKDYGVDGYPTVKVFRGPDNVAAYQGARKAPAIISYMTKQALPAVSILTPESIEEFKTQDKVVVVAYFDAEDKTSNTTFSEIAESMRDDYLFGATHDAKLAKAEGVKQPGIILYKSFDEGKSTFDGKFDKEDIKKFTKEAATPLVGEVGPETYASYMAAELPLAYIFAETEEERTELTETLKPLAQKFKGVVNFATIDAKAFGAHSENLNLKNGKWPAFAIQETVKNQKYPFDQEKKLTEKDVGKFVQDFVDGKIEPSVKSEPIPEKQEGPVQVVVAKNYKEVVLENENDVLLEYYAPWCGHCKALAPQYEELAAMYPASSLITIAKVDATANDVPDEIQGFPTIKLFPAGAKSEPLTYSGSRTIEDIAAFIKENGKYKVDAFEGKNKSEDDSEGIPLAEGMGEAAKAATESVKSKVGEAAEAVTSVAMDMEGDEGQEHDEL